MSDEPARGSNSEEIGLTQTDLRDLILAVLTIQRSISEMYGRWATVQEVERLLRRGESA